MRREVSTMLVLSILLIFGNSTTAAAPLQTQTGVSELTAAEVIDRLRTTSDDIVQTVGRAMADSAGLAVADLRILADRLEVALASDAQTASGKSRDQESDEVSQARAALALADETARALRTCIREDVQATLAAFRANLRHAIGVPGSWSDGRPRVLRMIDSEGVGQLVLRTGSPQPILVEGANLKSDACGPATAVITGPDGESVEVSAGIGAGRVVAFEVPPLDQPGVYQVAIRLRRRKLLLFCRSTSAVFAFPVVAAAPFRVRYTVSTTQAVDQDIRWNAGELKVTNEECDDTIASGVFRLPDGWSYVSHEWIVFLNSGSVKTKEEIRQNEVQVEYRLPGRGGPFCTGEPRLIHGRMEIHGTRVSVEPGPAVEGTLRQRLAYGQTVVVPVEIEPAEGARIAGWSIDVSVVYPDGSVHALPASSGDGPLRGTDGSGAAFTWDPAGRRLRISAPSGGCRPGSG